MEITHYKPQCQVSVAWKHTSSPSCHFTIMFKTLVYSQYVIYCISQLKAAWKVEPQRWSMLIQNLLQLQSQQVCCNQQRSTQHIYLYLYLSLQLTINNGWYFMVIWDASQLMRTHTHTPHKRVYTEGSKTGHSEIILSNKNRGEHLQRSTSLKDGKALAKLWNSGLTGQYILK